MTASSARENALSDAQRVAELEAQLRERDDALRTQQALLDIADLAYKAGSLEHLFASSHAIIRQFMYANNFYIALEHKDRNTISFPYYIDTEDPSTSDDIGEIPIGEMNRSLTAYLMRNDTTVFVRSAEEFEQLLHDRDLELVGSPPQCLLGVPIRRTGGQQGAIVVQSYVESARFTHADRDMLSFLAQHIATAFDRFEQRELLELEVAERTRSLQEKNQQLEVNLREREADKKLQAALYSLAQLAHGTDDINATFPKLHEILGSLFYAKNFYVALISDDGEEITFPYYSDDVDIKTETRKLGHGVTEYTLHSLKPELIQRNDLIRLIEEGELDPPGTHPESWIGAPIIVGNSAFGVIASQSYEKDHIFSEKDLELLSFAADQLAETLKRQQDSDAIMLANITLEARVEQRTWELSQINEQMESEIEERRRAEELQKTLFTIDELTHQIDDIGQFYNEIHQLIGKFIHAKHFFIAEYNDDNGKLYFPYYVDDTQNLADFTESTDDDPIPHMPFELIRKTMTAYVIRTGKSLLANDKIRRELEAAGEIGLVGVDPVDWLGVPLIKDNKVAGVIVVQTYDEQNRFGKIEHELLQFVASHITTALERKSYRDALEKRVEERTLELEQTNHKLQEQISVRERAENLQTALFRIADMTNSATDMTTFYRQIHEIIARLMYAKYFFIALLDSDQSNTLTFPYYIDIETHMPEPRAMGNHLTEHVIRTGKPLLLTPDNSEDIQKAIKIKGKIPVSWLGVPLILDGEILGALVVQTYDTAFVLSKNEEEILTYVSHHVATALDRKRARAKLEQRVEQRTMELREVNLSLERQIDKRRQIEKQLEHDAFHDALTQLPNRMLFMDRLNQLIAKGGRDTRFRYAVLFLDLDRFKVINDSLGHLAGDKLLQEVSNRLLKLVRPQDTVARLGGDEFCILLDDIQGLTMAELVAKRVCDDLTQPFNIDGNEVFTSTSIGIAYSALKYTAADDMLRDSDAAMYQAKMLGKRQYSVFDKSMHAKAMNTLKLETELRNAIRAGDIDVYYQPIVRLSDQQIDGFEALARWHHPNQGLIHPGDFIPLAEESGLITELDLAMCLKACLQVAQWQSEERPLTISVNLSSKHFSRNDLVEKIADILEVSSLKPSLLKLEITESALMENVTTAQKLLRALKDLGVTLAMDDFGTGYSSLSYLHRFPLDVLKVDRCFVDEIDIKKENKAIVSTIVTLANTLGMTSVAEGIETAEQLATVKALGCDLGQGYLFSKPMSHQDAERALRSG
ncbi:EAL domain-containing protein [Simiduia aestuariiviva]|uniref:cyclic-guanylate-specific phosphodiesterase n=1 Tax=Simiduia aestuariiviva TaxID=1510459 RepID=A0A839UN78_9GAMM|nr:EAL domain-containing protein [Simiduia aestuariiviva]MBB3169624.1 diguanylate cyclase (GGDEF)-like protein [Simiduia aestuariiviva]